MDTATAAAGYRTEMKLWGKLVFGSGANALQSVVRALCALPGTLRATRHSDGEDEVGRPIEDATARLGSILWAQQANYHAWAPGGGQVECTCEFKVDPPLVQAFMERMATLAPTFGYVCAWEEYLHRNQIVVKLRTGTLEAMLGKDLSKFVPGLYWLTVLSGSLAETHRVPLAELEAAALEHVALGGGLRLYRFHDHPAKWRARADELDALCASLPGVFNIADVRARLVGVTELSEYREVTRPWG